MAIIRLQLKLNIPPDTHSRENQPCHAYLSSSGDKLQENFWSSSEFHIKQFRLCWECTNSDFSPESWQRGILTESLLFLPSFPWQPGLCAGQFRLNAKLSSHLHMVIPQEFLHPFYTREIGNVKDFTTETENVKHFSSQKELCPFYDSQLIKMILGTIKSQIIQVNIPVYLLARTKAMAQSASCR